MKKLGDDWWESHRFSQLVAAPEGSRIHAPPPSFRFERIETFKAVRCELVIDNQFMKCLMGSKCFANLHVHGGRVDPHGVDFSGCKLLQLMTLDDCGMGLGRGEYVFPACLRNIKLRGNGITDLTRLKFGPGSGLALSLDLSENPIRSMAGLDPLVYDRLCFLYLRKCGIKSVDGWAPRHNVWRVDLTGNLLVALPEYARKGGLCWPILRDNPIEDISELCNATVNCTNERVVRARNFDGCPLNLVSQAILAAVDGMAGDTEKINAYLLAVRQVKFLWCSGEKLPRELWRALRAYLI